MVSNLLPSFCFPGRSIKVEGMGIHFTSGISEDVEPSNPFDMQVVWNMLHDLNLPKSSRKFYPNCAGIGRMWASYNLLIGRNPGEEWILVPLEKEAYHAGISKHGNREDCNRWMTGAALIGTEESLFSDWQYERLALRAAEHRQKYGFPNSDIVGHDRLRHNAKLAGLTHDDGRIPADKRDPSGKADGTGKNFDWPRFYSMVDALLEQKRKLAQA